MPKGREKALAKGRSPQQELEVGRHSWSYLLVLYNYIIKFIRFDILMKEFIALLKNKIIPYLLAEPEW